MMQFYFILLSGVLSAINCAPGSYQYVRFIRNGKSGTGETLNRRSIFPQTNIGFDLSLPHGDLPVWEEEIYHPAQHLTNSVSFDENRGHITPDFSNGLEYPDPLLLTGLAAKRAALYLYRKPLFFGDIKHVESLLKNQDHRRENGLAGNKLGSLRPRLPFYRFKHEQTRSFFK